MIYIVCASLTLAVGVIFKMKNEPLLVTLTERPFYVYTNPSFPKLSEIGPVIRFFANNGNKTIYAWNYYDGFHAQVAIGLKFLETFNSRNLLRGHSGKNNAGYHQMVGSDFLSSFLGKMTNKNKIFLNDLLSQNWDWVEKYIKISEWMDSYRKRLGL
jgi:hypothetical protein